MGRGMGGRRGDPTASGSADARGRGGASVGDELPPLPGVRHGERVRFRCERERGFLATFYGAPRPVCIIETGDQVSFELPLVGRTDAAARYSDGSIRLTVGSAARAELSLGPGETLVECEALLSSG